MHASAVSCKIVSINLLTAFLFCIKVSASTSCLLLLNTKAKEKRGTIAVMVFSSNLTKWTMAESACKSCPQCKGAPLSERGGAVMQRPLRYLELKHVDAFCRKSVRCRKPLAALTANAKRDVIVGKRATFHSTAHSHAIKSKSIFQANQSL